MSGIELIVVYLSGLFTGLVFGLVGIMYIGKKSLDKDKAAKQTVSERLAKVRELTELQLAMQQAASGPQKNALDGKYKNGLNKTIKELEEEKAEILQSILQDGHDPEVTVQGANGLEKMKLSAFLVQQGYDVGSKTKVDKALAPKKNNPFTVVKGGKSDDGGDGQTFH